MTRIFEIYPAKDGKHNMLVAIRKEHKSISFEVELAGEFNKPAIVFHQSTPIYEGQSISDRSCKLIKCSCYMHRTEVIGETALAKLKQEGTEGVYQYLEALYNANY